MNKMNIFIILLYIRYFFDEFTYNIKYVWFSCKHKKIKTYVEKMPIIKGTWYYKQRYYLCEKCVKCGHIDKKSINKEEYTKISRKLILNKIL